MLGAYEIDCDGDGSAETLVKLRNPWSELGKIFFWILKYIYFKINK